MMMKGEWLKMTINKHPMCVCYDYDFNPILCKKCKGVLGLSMREKLLKGEWREMNEKKCNCAILKYGKCIRCFRIVDRRED